jgi:hypothetical protein
MSQKTAFFIVTATKTSNLNNYNSPSSSTAFSCIGERVQRKKNGTNIRGEMSVVGGREPVGLRRTVKESVALKGPFMLHCLTHTKTVILSSKSVWRSYVGEYSAQRGFPLSEPTFHPPSVVGLSILFMGC